MSFMAEHADDNLLIDPAPNQETIAGFFETTTRTVRTWLNRLVEEGEIEQTRIGSGPGNPSAYRILLPVPNGKGGSKAEENTAKPSAFVYILEELKAEVSSLKAEVLEIKAEAKGGKGGSERRKPRSSKIADDPYYDPEEIEEKEEDIYIPPQSDLVSRMITAVSAISRETHWSQTHDTFTDAAYELIGRDIEPEQIAPFGVWWSGNGWHKTKPVLKNILDHWEDFRAGRSLRKPDKNGQKQDDINSQFDFSTMTDKGW
jgi:hypothetical protein